MNKSIITIVFTIIASCVVVSAQETDDNVNNLDAKMLQIPSVRKQFAWGVDVGSAIDMTGKDMSAIDINAYLGYSGPYVRFAGLGTGIDMMVSSSSSVYPVYALFRTDFNRDRQLCFMEVRSGVSVCQINDLSTQTNVFESIGVGVTLAKGQSFSSHILLSYNYINLKKALLPDGNIARLHDIHYASIRIGISF